MFSDAIDRAKWLDAQFQRRGKQPVGPLHGLPISVKDQFYIKGYDSCLGTAGLCFRPAKMTNQAVQVLLNAGCVIIGKTIVPQSVLTADMDLIVFGRTINPYNAEFASGGSSGDEGVLLAMGGSSLGLATDGGGSVRILAATCGVGYKSSAYRIPIHGQRIVGKGIMGTTSLVSRISALPEFSVEYLHQLNYQVARLAMQMKRILNVDNGKQLDAILFATALHTALRFDKFVWLGLTSIFNVLDCASISIPLNEAVDKKIDTATPVLTSRGQSRL
ncbi:uncharacterized protein TrAFT101_000306 [Trichoderma asperellum]|uniref:uncharacterized protein n=1 Tax=Trichoderma asperellum TaxID=101201 RepID=UPI00331AFEFA|nr:hypothetical protein TrAFT101_000306 [Trichoderma asperellum]